jgi:hypothetical protein
MTHVREVFGSNRDRDTEKSEIRGFPQFFHSGT